MKIRDIIGVVDITKRINIKCYDENGKARETTLPAVPNHIIQDADALKASIYDRNITISADTWTSEVKQISTSFDTVIISTTTGAIGDE